MGARARAGARERPRESGSRDKIPSNNKKCFRFVRGLKGLSLTRCLALLDPLDATAERERERIKHFPSFYWGGPTFKIRGKGLSGPMLRAKHIHAGVRFRP